MSRRFALAGSLAFCVFFAPAARADPQTHVAWRPSLCGVGSDEGAWEKTRFCNGLTGDVLFFRRKNRDFGFGPYVDVTTAGFWDFRWGGGATVLLPVTENFPVTLSLGLSEHALRSPAFAASAFFGARSYNFDGVYNWSLGVFAGVTRDFSDPHDSLVTLGLEIDGFFVIAPFLFGVSALR
ncbi:MAG TPA: hypothetical protein VMI54_03665 [Polyangiaceae bacterium]|nr:hypothetical protein [Polyangiaceae bacterium]